MRVIETYRLVLRAFKETDLDDFFAYAKSQKVGPMAGWKPHTNIEESKNILKSFMDGDEIWAIEFKEDHKVIGSIGLHQDAKRSNPQARMLGYVLSEDYWGSGIMLEASRALLNYAFNECRYDLVSVYHFPFNLQSKSVIEKIGFKYEGCLRQTTLRFDGVLLDSMCYSITKDEFNAL